MTFDDYQKQAQRTSSTLGMNAKIENGCMGLCGESGECMDILKKHRHQGHAMNRDKLIDEASDVLWYLAELATGLGISLGEIAQHNFDKLWDRYPSGFDSNRSVNRKE